MRHHVVCRGNDENYRLLAGNAHGCALNLLVPSGVLPYVFLLSSPLGCSLSLDVDSSAADAVEAPSAAAFGARLRRSPSGRETAEEDSMANGSAVLNKPIAPGSLPVVARKKQRRCGRGQAEGRSGQGLQTRWLNGQRNRSLLSEPLYLLSSHSAQARTGTPTVKTGAG